MDQYNIIVKPLVTEKSTEMQSAHNVYAFEVNKHADKHQIKKAIESLYSVKVLDVRTMNRKGKPRRTRHKIVTTGEWKRAIVQLDENSRIDLF